MWVAVHPGGCREGFPDYARFSFSRFMLSAFPIISRLVLIFMLFLSFMLIKCSEK